MKNFMSYFSLFQTSNMGDPMEGFGRSLNNPPPPPTPFAPGEKLKIHSFFIRRMFLFPPIHFLKFLIKFQPQRSYKKILIKKRVQELPYFAIFFFFFEIFLFQDKRRTHSPRDFATQIHGLICLCATEFR